MVTSADRDTAIVTIDIGIAGAGRMGQAIAAAIQNDTSLRLAGVWARDPSVVRDRFPGKDALVSDDLDAVLELSDVLIDFSLPQATNHVIEGVLQADTPLVCGVSGLSAVQLTALDKAAARLPVVFDRNMSQGIAVLDSVVRQVAKSLGAEFDIEIHETHHVHKVDSPSGTALKLGETIARERGIDSGDLHYDVQRHGEVPGDHAVVFQSPTERLEFRHSVTTRDVFALGALRAARWLVGRPPGRYSMADVLA